MTGERTFLRKEVVPMPSGLYPRMRLLAALLSGASAVLVNNTAPTLDSTGAILDCADSTYTFTDSRWFAVCVSYGACIAPVPLGCTVMPDNCGHRLDHNVSIFSSPDLSSGSWVFERLAFHYTERPVGILYRPHVVFNAATKKWVLWCNIFNVGVFQGYFAANVSRSKRGSSGSLET